MTTDSRYEDERKEIALLFALLYEEVRARQQRIKELITTYEKRTGRSPFHKTGGWVGEPWDSAKIRLYRRPRAKG